MKTEKPKVIITNYNIQANPVSAIAASNRLGSSLSPYLLQHQDNPVHWQPWDDEALDLARTQEAPILLSIGYAACHWCHVMERESFADAEIARLMNEGFVCIKVDREERPDLDRAYQMAHFLLSRSSGGWPLTAFLAPEDLVPFHTGTYYPPRPRGSMPSLPDILRRVQAVWANGREQVAEQNAHIGEVLASIDTLPPEEGFTPRTASALCREQLSVRFDQDNGGLGKAPKFPQLPQLQYTLAPAAAGDATLRAGLGLTLDAMAQRGLRDHIGGGFFRYCVDPLWDIPHFEKMMSDNVQLIELYARAGAVYGNQAYLDVARDTISWLRTMELEPGGYASALDADSEGGEGRHYLWSRTELEHALEPAALAALDEHTNAAEPANFEGGMLHLRLRRLPSYEGHPPALAPVREQLGKLRADRPAPAVDGKMLLSNCALAAQAYGVAGRILGDDGLLQAARQGLDFIEQRLRSDGRLMLYRTAAGLAGTTAFLDDYAYYLQAQVTLLQADPSPARLAAVESLIEEICAWFDDEDGGLLFASKDAPQALRRLRACDDGPLPSGNGIIAQELVRFAHLSAQPRHLDQAERIITAFSAHLQGGPSQCCSLMRAAELLHQPPMVVIIPAAAGSAQPWIKDLMPAYACGTMLVCTDPQGEVAEVFRKPAPAAGGLCAYLCSDMKCSEPIADLAELKRSLAGD